MESLKISVEFKNEYNNHGLVVHTVERDQNRRGLY